MRFEGSVTALSWIPSEAVAGLAKLPFGSGVAHYDVAPPDVIGQPGTTVDELREADRFRFANHLSAWVETDDNGTIVGAGYQGGGLIGSTTLTLGKGISIAAVALPDKQAEPEIVGERVRFLQTRRRPHGGARAPHRSPVPLRAVPRADCLVDTRPHDP